MCSFRRVVWGQVVDDRSYTHVTKSLKCPTAGRSPYWYPAVGSTTTVFSQLMALARYTSVGSHSAYGMGVIDVVADAP